MFSLEKDIPQVYTIIENNLKAALNSMPYTTNPVTIPIGIVAPADGDFTLTLKGTDSFSSLSDLTLEDLKLNITQNMIQIATCHGTPPPRQNSSGSCR